MALWGGWINKVRFWVVAQLLLVAMSEFQLRCIQAFLQALNMVTVLIAADLSHTHIG